MPTPATDTPEPSPASVSPVAGRTRSLVVILGVAFIAALVGFVASSWVKSPAQLAAQTAPPPASVITAPVENRVVADTLITRGSVGSVSTVNAVPEQRPSGVASALVTRLPRRVGAQLTAGQEIVEISGQPVFFLPGAIPAYRDLGPGDVGPDVSQLHRALRKAGQTVADPQGTYGSTTAAAVSALFTRSGHRPIGAGALPMSAVTYVDTDTSTLVVAKAVIGQPAADADLQLASGNLVVFAATTVAARDQVRVGAEVAITAELLGESATGTITHVNKDGDGGSVTITPSESLDPRWAGQDVRVDIAGTGSGGKVLAVPVSAVSLDAAGQAILTVRDRDHEVRLQVTVGATGDGYVEVAPADGQSLAAGDRVVIGVG